MNMGFIGRVLCDVLTIQRKNIALHPQHTRKITRRNELLHRRRHTAYGKVESEQAHKTLMNNRWNGLALLATTTRKVKRGLLHTIFDEKFFKRERVHAKHLLITHRKRRNLVIQDAKKRPRLNVVKASIIHKKLNGRASPRTLLHFVKKYQRGTRFKRHAAESS